MTSSNTDTLDRLAAEAEKSRADAAAIQQRLDQARAQQAAEEAAQQERNAKIEYDYARQHFNFADLRRCVHQAEEAITEAVRTGGDAVAAYLTYRVTVATGLAQLRADAAVINAAADRQKQAVRDRLQSIQDRAKNLAVEHIQLTTTAQPVANAGPALLAARNQPPRPARTLTQWRADVHQWHKDVAVFQGRNPDSLGPAELDAIPEPIDHDYGPHLDRIPSVRISDDLLSNAYDSFDQAITAAVHKIEAEEVQQTAADRAAEIAKLQQQG